MNTTLKHLSSLNDLDFDINETVRAASQVIAPYGPITAFAARDPWAGLESHTFEEAARRLKNMGDVDILPNDSLFQSARKKGDINMDHLKEALHSWLDEQSFAIPRDVQERYGWSFLLQEKALSQTPSDQQLKSLIKRLSRFSSQMDRKEIIQTYSKRLEQLGVENTAEYLNFHIIKWCKLFLDENQAVWTLPYRDQGFYGAWRRLVTHDPSLNRMIRKPFKNVPELAEEALVQALLDLNIHPSQFQEYLEAHLLALPGWAGVILWRAEKYNQHQLLTEYLAVRVTMEAVLVRPYLPIKSKKNEDRFPIEKLVTDWGKWGGMALDDWENISIEEQKARLIFANRFDDTRRRLLWLEAWEKTYEDHLKTVMTKKHTAISSEKRIMAQFAFCIDVRSEPYRRLLEKAGPFETFGTAGFFGLPIKSQKLGHCHSHRSLPVMLKPQYKVQETLNESERRSFQKRLNTANSPSTAFKSLKHQIISSLMLPEISGPWLTLHALASNFMPKARTKATRKIRDKWFGHPNTRLTIDRNSVSDDALPVGFTDEEKAYYARQALEMMGLTDHFAPLVVICGHESESLNNPHATALDCSACGGASSAFNARLLAALCNLPSVRKTLADEGIVIPQDTVFVAAKHLTTVDELIWMNIPELSDQAQVAFDQLQAVLPTIANTSASKRVPQLPSVDSNKKDLKAQAERRAKDWSEVRPEWGLARNAAFVIGDRELTKDCDLEGRVFLHNYHWPSDKNGRILSNIIKGPVTVAQWINLQYYASTVAPHYYGSGNKVTQTVTSGIGVMQGNASDLLTGLPWQSVMSSDHEAFHEPLRLLTIIQAPDEHIKRALDFDRDFHQKVKNGWIRLASIDQEGNWKNWH
ncbi:MAG: DUF2309 domain-containing protein [Tuberibacillus sp.]